MHSMFSCWQHWASQQLSCGKKNEKASKVIFCLRRGEIIWKFFLLKISFQSLFCWWRNNTIRRKEWVRERSWKGKVFKYNFYVRDEKLFVAFFSDWISSFNEKKSDEDFRFNQEMDLFSCYSRNFFSKISFLLSFFLLLSLAEKWERENSPM